MFVVPPPPPPPPLSSYGNGAVQGASTSPLEFNNTLSHPTGPEHRFLAGEGAYVLRSDLHLAAPPPHVPDGPLPSANPPTSTAYPLRTGTRLSLALTTPRKTASRPIKDDASFHPYFQTVQSNGSRSRQNRSSGDSDRVERGSDNSSTQPSSDAANGPSSSESGAAPVFGESNVLLSGPPAKDAPKRRKHKTNIVKSNSTFVSRVVAHETLSKRLQDHKPDGPFAFANVGRAMQWLDMSSSSAGEPLTKLLFSRAQPLCHDVNQLTRSSSSLDVVVGFSTGDILSYEPMSGKYARINKNGVITSSAVTEIRWVPGSENLFLAAHSDGTMIVYDKDKEDAPFMVSDETLFVRPQPAGSRTLDAGIQVIKSVNSPNQRCNPVAYWKLSYQRINAFAFSPDNKHLAVVSEDGTLRVVDHLKEALLDVYSSYYGGFICVCWSPDAKYILTGGQDDLVSIWSLAECRLVARCEGHQSWVTAVAFDPWRCDGRDYRFGSVGEDCRLLLWDFSVGMLHRPKTASIRQRGSISSAFGAYRPGMYRADGQITSRFRSNSTLASVGGDGATAMKHQVQSRLETARLPPIMSKVIDPHPLCSLSFQDDCIVTSCVDGHLRMWDRPRKGINTG